MTVRLPEADEFERLRANHELEWPDDVKQAARQVQLSLNVANGTGFKGSQALQDLLAADWADFQAKLEKWKRGRLND